jgi:hypothetical protein
MATGKVKTDESRGTDQIPAVLMKHDVKYCVLRTINL